MTRTRMTMEEFNEKQTLLLHDVHPILASAIRIKAYEDGHSGGYEEALNLVQSMVGDFSKVNDVLFGRQPKDW